VIACDHPEHARRTRVEAATAVIGRCSVCEKDVEWEFDYSAASPGDEGLVDALDNAYRERNAVVAALIRVGGYRAWRMLAPDAEGWWIVYAETPMGQVSWHVAPVDIRLFDGVPVGSDPWDGHTTEEKYDRVARLVPAASSEAAVSPGDSELQDTFAGSRPGSTTDSAGLTPVRDASDELELRDASSASPTAGE